nr:MAG TPA_asm: hypothetical protein [Caudoviricetes sp.]
MILSSIHYLFFFVRIKKGSSVVFKTAPSKLMFFLAAVA